MITVSNDPALSALRLELSALIDYKWSEQVNMVERMRTAYPHSIRPMKVVAHFIAEAPSKRARIRQQRKGEEHAPGPPKSWRRPGHPRAPLRRRRVRAAASCPSSRPTSARATATPRGVSR